MERPTICFIICNLNPLPNFGTQPITYAQSASGADLDHLTITDARTSSPEAYNMYDCSYSTQLDSTQAFTSSTDFSVKWLNYGPICE